MHDTAASALLAASNHAHLLPSSGDPCTSLPGNADAATCADLHALYNSLGGAAAGNRTSCFDWSRPYVEWAPSCDGLLLSSAPKHQVSDDDAVPADAVVVTSMCAPGGLH